MNVKILMVRILVACIAVVGVGAPTFNIGQKPCLNLARILPENCIKNLNAASQKLRKNPARILLKSCLKSSERFER